MPFHRRSLRPIKTDKHEVTFTELSQDAGAARNVPIAVSVQSADKDNSTEVEVGSHIKWLYCEINFAAETITVAKTVHWTIRMAPPASAPSTPVQLYAVDRSYVLKRGMEMLPKDVATVYKRIFVVNIPQAYQRMKQGQILEFEYQASSTNTMNTCGIFIYKEIY